MRPRTGVGDALQLQRAAGNRAVGRAVAGAMLARKFRPENVSLDWFTTTFSKDLALLPWRDKEACFVAIRNDEVEYPDHTAVSKRIREWRASRPQSDSASAAAASSSSSSSSSSSAAGSLPSMARIENPDWDEIRPLLAGYGIESTDWKKIEDALAKVPKALPLRGIPDLIGRALGAARMNEAVAHVKEQNTAAAGDPGQRQMITLARGDTRSPALIKSEGGLFGWSEGIVTVEHARRIVAKVANMTVKEQRDWVNRWKRPTPSKDERNPWVAAGTGAEGGQKGGGEYFFRLPLTFAAAGDKRAMIVGTDTPDMKDASVIAVRLDPQGSGSGDEVIVLTGVPWKYLTAWEGLVNGRLQRLDPEDAAAATSGAHT